MQTGSFQADHFHTFIHLLMISNHFFKGSISESTKMSHLNVLLVGFFLARKFKFRLKIALLETFPKISNS